MDGATLLSFMEVSFSGVLLKPPTTDPPTTCHLHTDPLTGYRQFKLKQKLDPKH